ncbi:MAG: TetR family transcriptional regulator [Gordonia sp. (in: high G+C Gram-positive bacteria)]|uniref:TetR family transcriptional regulator n=1 Tax=Gordonia sp. (in: high G+C Gram-positive bacteria) TaxID=84139 RepID=UPI0039E3B4AC
MSLRERNKARTRAAIRAAALDLISRQGYQATTVAQIADAAQVSHTTFFRYFETKEQVILADDLDGEFERTLGEIPPGLNRFDLLRQMFSRLFELGSSDPWVSNPDRATLIRSEPTLLMAQHAEMDRVITRTTEFIADYTGTSADDLRLRVFVGAMAGAVAHIVDKTVAPDEATHNDVLTAIDLLEQGLPL